MSYRQLNAPGLDELTGRGVYYGSALTEASACVDQDVYIVGGANSAGQAAVYLSRHAKSVTLLVRGPSLERSMSYYLIQQSRCDRNLVRPYLHRGHPGRRRRATWSSSPCATPPTAARKQSTRRWLFVFIGAAPLTDWLDGVVVRDDHGFVVAGPDLSAGPETAAAGSWTGRPITWRPACRACSWPVTPAPNRPSGSPPPSAKGAMAVMLVHRYLEKL